MSILKSFFASEPPPVVGGFLSDLSASAAEVTAESALSYSAVYSGIRLLSDSIAMFPKPVYKRNEDGGRDPAPGHPVAQMLARSINTHAVPLVVFRQLMCQAIIFGRAAAVIEFDGGRPKHLWPLANPRALVPTAIDGNLVYYYPNQIYKGRNFLWPDEIVYLPAMGLDGRTGLGLLDVAKTAIGLGLSSERATAEFYDNGFRLGGILTTEQQLSPEAKDRLKKQMKAGYAGARKHGTLMVLEQGLTYKETVGALRDAENLDQRRHAVVDMSRFLGVPPPLLQALENAHFRNVVELKQTFLEFSLLPWITLFEQELNTKLFVGKDRGKYYVEFLTEGFVRVDIEKRYNAYAKAIANGWMSVNDVRRKENQPLIPPEKGGDDYLRPLAMAPAGSLAHQAKFVAELAQKVYLAVGKLLTPEEGRDLLIEAGAKLDPNAVLPIAMPGLQPQPPAASPDDESPSSAPVPPQDEMSSALPRLKDQIAAAAPLLAQQLRRLSKRMDSGGRNERSISFAAKALEEPVAGFVAAALLADDVIMPEGYCDQMARRLSESDRASDLDVSLEIACYELRRAAWCAFAVANKSTVWVHCGCGAARNGEAHPPLKRDCTCALAVKEEEEK